ncbi:globin domain-containing protein [Lignipirellula cremea]|uniref:Flavohemoprotein n=1 Tax=Lignipirellula cremea TaxID=2528010 RepID=A0A518DM01_9BACT|nr:globin domain-containing protein [Lignipirellula cremea]QDU92864.1 Flavohemoprotein [Lignipirellula cremea]
MQVSTSLAAVLDSQTLLGELFYKQLFEDYPELRRYFSEIDMPRQRMMLTMALTIIAQVHDTPRRATVAYLRYLGTRHYDRAIPREAYDLWRRAMLATLAGLLGSDWTESLEADWNDAIDQTVKIMMEGYDQRFHV